MIDISGSLVSGLGSIFSGALQVGAWLMALQGLFLGLMVLFYGRRSFWVLASVVGFVLGLWLASGFGAGLPAWAQPLLALVLGLAGAAVGFFAPRPVATFIGGLALALLGAAVVRGVGAASWLQWLAAIVLGAAGIYLFWRLLDWALIVGTSLFGAVLASLSLSSLFGFTRALGLLPLLLFLTVGIVYQARDRRMAAELKRLRLKPVAATGASPTSLLPAERPAAALPQAVDTTTAAVIGGAAAIAGAMVTDRESALSVEAAAAADHPDPQSGVGGGIFPSPAADRLGFSVANMDPSVNPAQDFYRFAASGWLDQTVIPDTEGRVDGFIGLHRQVNQQILDLLQTAAANSATAPRGSVEQQVGDFFASAMDTARLDALGIAPLQPEFERIDAMATREELAATLVHLMTITGSGILLVPFVFADRKQSDLNSLGIYPGGLSLGTRDLYLTEAYAPLRAAFLEHVARMLQLAGATAQEAAQQAQIIMEIETALATAKLTPVEAADPAATYNPMPVADLQALAPHFDLATFFAQLGLTTKQVVVVAEPRFVQAIEMLLVERPIADFRIYLRWRLLNGMSQYLSPAIAEADLDFFVKTLQGTPALLPREQRVASHLQNSFGHPVAQLYVKAHFSPVTRAQVTDLVGRIKAQFRKRLTTNRWLDESTRSFALDKLARMEIRVGYPDNWIDYSGVEIRRDDYLGNVMRLNRFDITRNLAKAGLPVVDDEFAIPNATLPTTINAAYQPAANKIELCAAFLQPPFFFPDLDATVNYGTLGAVIGHEMTHGFDSTGRHFDAAGNLTDWWTANDSEEFEAFTDRLVAQYDRYEALPGVPVNGKLTVTENTADLGGVTLAFHALQEVLAEQAAPGLLDGYSPDERFFIAWAQLWMSKVRPEVLQLLISSDPHPPSAVRATGPLVNLDAFFATFAIQPGDAMWRDKNDRIEIW